jgi:hypothetical protein
MRALFLGACLSLGFAPLQCGSGDPEDVPSETPPEALYHLSEHFQKQGDEKARVETLEFLIERYPNSRFAVRARNELEREQKAP